MEIPVIEISGRYATEIWVMSDVHYGHVQCDIEHFKVYLDWLGKGYHKVIGIGDYFVRESYFFEEPLGKNSERGYWF